MRPSVQFVSRARVPAVPPTFRSEQATVYQYFNLVMPVRKGVGLSVRVRVSMCLCVCACVSE